MAALDQQVCSFDNGLATVTVTFDDVTGIISRIAWANSGGPITIKITQPGKADIVITKPGNNSGSQAVNPALGYSLNSACGLEIAWSEN